MDEIYRRHPAEYDRLVNAEDHERHLPALLNAFANWRGQTVLEGGLGTGRVTALYVEPVGRIVRCDREPHMLAAALFAQGRKNLVPGAPVVLVETLGTLALSPAAPHPRLAEFYHLLQSRFGLRQTALSTDYRFPSVAAAAETLGFFFGDDMAPAVRAANFPVVPEWTGVWHGPLPS